MKKIRQIIQIVFTIVIAGLFISCHDYQEPSALVPFSDVAIEFASSKAGGQYLLTGDDYLNNLTTTDLSLYYKTTEPVALQTYLNYLPTQALDWTAAEKEAITEFLNELKSSLFVPYKLLFPQNIAFVKTSGNEVDLNGVAGYCRSKNIVVLTQICMNLIDSNPSYLKYIIIHELFHIFSRNNPDARKELYDIISFKEGPALIMPEALKQKKISNPDTMWDLYYFESVVNETNYKLMPFSLAIFPSYDASQGLIANIFTQLCFVAVTQQGNTMILVKENGDYVIFPLSEVPDFLSVIGKNTAYDIHPEEVMADNFSFLIMDAPNLPSPEIIDKMRNVLKK
ncbi:MAG: hypothetical protein LBN93_03790 [Candidatus Symbiothrix sp.]|jgi:hypothetical protein|nr:hypothetical protein [Candidatus Symbiothrix sp.]